MATFWVTLVKIRALLIITSGQSGSYITSYKDNFQQSDDRSDGSTSYPKMPGLYFPNVYLLRFDDHIDTKATTRENYFVSVIIRHIIWN